MIEKRFITDEDNNIVEEFFDNVTGKSGTDEDIKKRFRTQQIKGDIYDLIAQSLQWNSLLTSLIKDLYDVLDAEVKDKLPQDKRYLIEASFNYFGNIETVADVKLKKEGFDFIKKIFDKEAETAELFK